MNHGPFNSHQLLPNNHQWKRPPPQLLLIPGKVPGQKPPFWPPGLVDPKSPEAPEHVARHPQLLWSVAFAPEGHQVAACHGAVGQSPAAPFLWPTFFEDFLFGVGWLFSYKGDEILTSCCGWQMVDFFFIVFFHIERGCDFFCNSCIGSTLGLLSYSLFFFVVGWLFEAKAV